MKYSQRSLILLTALWSTCAFSQQGDVDPLPRAELTLSNDTLQLQYLSTARFAGLDRARLAGAFFLSEERDVVFSGGLLLPATLDDARLSLKFGPQAYAALLEDENDDVLALSVGAEARLLLNRSNNLAVMGFAYYAPDILTFGSADAVTDLGARVEVNLGPRLMGFGGMRWFEFDLTDGDGERTLQEELFAGFGWKF